MAATTAIAGYGGSLTGPTGITEVTQWKASISTEKLDATNMGSAGWKEYIPGLIGMEGSCTCQGTAIPSRGLAACALTTNGGPTFSGSVFVDKVDINVPVEGKVSYDVSFAFTGSITVG
jgi:hypothetical protein